MMTSGRRHAGIHWTRIALTVFGSALLAVGFNVLSQIPLVLK